VSYFGNVADALASAPDPDRNGSGAHGWKALGTGNGTAFEWSVLRQIQVRPRREVVASKTTK